MIWRIGSLGGNASADNKLSEKREQKSWQEVSRGGEGSVCNSLLRYIKIPATFHPGWEGSRRVPQRACPKKPSCELD